MSDNPQQWDEQGQWLFIQQQGRRGQTAQSSSNDSYSPQSSTSDLSSLSHGGCHWSSGAAAFNGPPVTAWTGPHPNPPPLVLPTGPTLEQRAAHGQHGSPHAGCHPMGTICQSCMILHQFRESNWRCRQEMEPRDPNGRSPLLVLLAELPDTNGGRIYACRICEDSFARLDRAVTHLRHKHLDHRPYACQGRCGVPECEQRFHSQENLAPHINPKTVDCRFCDHKCLRQNIKRHMHRYHANELQAQPNPM